MTAPRSVESSCSSICSWIDRRRLLALGLAFGFLAAPRAASAATYHYVQWTAADVGAGTASGTITLPGGSVVTVQFAAVNSDGSAGNLYGAQVNGGMNYWNPSTPYISAQVENAPPDTDILQLSGGQNQTYRVSLSEAIKDPIMAIVSLGQGGVATTYDFDAPFTIVSQGAGYWGGSSTALAQEPNDVLRGNEGHGTIQFIGTFRTFSWTVPTPETWHGFTFGIRTTEALEPSDAGADAASDASTDSGTTEAGAPTGGTPDAGKPSATNGGGATTTPTPGGGNVVPGPVDAPPPAPPRGSDSSCSLAIVGRPAAGTVPAILAVAAIRLLAKRRRRQSS